ncbi:MAG: hypothetical protein K0V04_02575 [Deltaproteobacteria bacterium]|nr:hypothetical protein [Deltaproteobacteria bacterium]
MMRRTLPTFTTLALATATAALCLAPASTDAASPAYCAPTAEMDPLQLLRQSSLDLRGRVPAFEEYEQVRDAADPQAEVETLVAQMLESEEFFTTIRDYHQGLIWGTLDDSILTSLFASQRRLRRNGADTWRLTNMRRQYRGNFIDCLDEPQVEFDAQGRPVPISVYQDPACDDGTCQQEGYVMVAPYWDPDNPIQVCAFDAQEALLGESGVECSVYHPNDEECGCGPELTWCGPDSAGTPNQLIRDSLAQEPARIFEWVVRQGASYLDAFSTRMTFMNGPVAHYYRHNTGTTAITLGGAVAYEPAVGSVPDLQYGDTDNWVGVEREAPHGGAFTTLGYLIRFASNRSRANRFYTAFYCDPFVPSEDGLPPEGDNPSPNLRERAGCADCHQSLEPAAAHWARWRTGGTYGFFSPEEFSFEEPRTDCVCGPSEGLNNCSAYCSTYFVTADNSSDEEFGLYAGLPQSGSWLEGQDPQNVEAGPAALVDSPEERAQVAQCAVRNLSEHLLGRELGTDDFVWLDGHSQAFADSGYDYAALVRRLVTDERYRTIR